MDARFLPLALGVAAGALFVNNRRTPQPLQPMTNKHRQNELSFGSVVEFNDHIANEMASGENGQIESVVGSVVHSKNSGVGHPHKVITIKLKSGEFAHFIQDMPINVGQGGVPSHL